MSFHTFIFKDTAHPNSDKGANFLQIGGQEQITQRDQEPMNYTVKYTLRGDKKNHMYSPQNLHLEVRKLGKFKTVNKRKFSIEKVKEHPA